jgi:acyl carrier protein
LASERSALGLPATCISWGPIGDAGYLARNEKVRDALVGRIGGRALVADDALQALDALLATKQPRIGFLELDWNVLGRALPAACAPKFSELARRDDRSVSNEPAHDVQEWLAKLPANELQPALIDIVRGEVAQILRTAPERVQAGVSLFDLGMDSLMAVELATSIDSRLGIKLSGLSLSDAPTIERVAARIAHELRPDEELAAGQSATADPTEQIRLAAARHASEMSEAELTAIGTELRGATRPLSLTEAQKS